MASILERKRIYFAKEAEPEDNVFCLNQDYSTVFFEVISWFYFLIATSYSYKGIYPWLGVSYFIIHRCKIAGQHLAFSTENNTFDIRGLVSTRYIDLVFYQ